MLNPKKSSLESFDIGNFTENEFPTFKKHIDTLRKQGQQGFVVASSAIGFIMALPVDIRRILSDDKEQPRLAKNLNNAIRSGFMAPLPLGKIMHLSQSPFPGGVIEAQPLSMADMKERVPGWKALYPEGYFFTSGENAAEGAFNCCGSFHDEPEEQTRAFFSLIFALLNMGVYKEYEVGKTYHLPRQLPFPGTVLGKIGHTAH